MKQLTVIELQNRIRYYEQQLKHLEVRRLTAKQEGHSANESYFMGQWCRLGNVICDLKGIMREESKESVLQ